MNLITMGIGLLPCTYGIFVLILRLKGQDGNFKKLAAMKEKWGERTGSIIHYITYVAVPFIFGVVIIYSGYAGLSLADFLAA